jgi:hypothetical protein
MGILFHFKTLLIPNHTRISLFSLKMVIHTYARKTIALVRFLNLLALYNRIIDNRSYVIRCHALI